MRNAAIALTLIIGGVVAQAASAAAIVGQPAPSFTLLDSHGAKQSLEAYRGKFVVLEWVNFECPFVAKHYGSGNMQRLQKDATARGVVWLSINSSAPGKQGNYPAARIDAMSKERAAAPSAYLIDDAGSVGRAYGAKTTPHMFVIDPAGKLLYAGGIDDKPTTEVADVRTAKNFVKAALDEALAGKPVSVSSSQAYGCGVKY